jgi:hypothetical protein
MPSAGEPRPCSVFEAEFSGYRFDSSTPRPDAPARVAVTLVPARATRTSPKSNARDLCLEIIRTRSKSSSSTRTSSSLRSHASVIQAVVPSRSFSEFFSFSCDNPTDSPGTGTCVGLDRGHADNDAIADLIQTLEAFSGGSDDCRLLSLHGGINVGSKPRERCKVILERGDRRRHRPMNTYSETSRRRAAECVPKEYLWSTSRISTESLTSRSNISIVMASGTAFDEYDNTIVLSPNCLIVWRIASVTVRLLKTVYTSSSTSWSWCGA